MGFRFKIDTRQLKKVNKELDRVIKQSLKKSNMAKLAEEAGDVIYKRTKSGKGVTSLKDNAKLVKLNSLDPKYIKQRKGRDLGEFGRPAKSNLTLTGQMLNAIVYTEEFGRFILEIDQSARFDSNKTNAKIAEYVQDQGRLFFNLAESEQRIVRFELEKIINKIIRRP